MTSLRCFRCGEAFAFDPRAYLCPACGIVDGDPAILDVEYDYVAASAAISSSTAKGVFRWLPLLPVDRVGDSLPAGGTPLVAAPRLAARLGLQSLLLKDETRNPTRCFKDRATAVFVAMAQSLGVEDVYCASAGNAAISLAGFSAHLGLRCHVYVPSYASEVRLDWLRRFGADLHVSTGDYDQAYAEAESAGKANGWYSRNCAFNPFLVEGKKTAGLEIAEQLDAPPDFVVVPVGDGCTLAAIGKGFREAREIGIIDRLPRLVGVQSAAAQPIVNRAHGGGGSDGEGTSRAESILVRKPRNVRRLVRELEVSGGEMIAVTDGEIAAAQRDLATEAGTVAEFTSAATLASLYRMRAQNPDAIAGKTVVLVITGGRPD
ncbi:MAG: pyridoxal-phosphate dependent enzyme [Bryobacteraceae bacterium]